MSTHDLCFRAKIRKNEYPCKPYFYYIKVGYKGVLITWSCYPDDEHKLVDVMKTTVVVKTVKGTNN